MNNLDHILVFKTNIRTDSALQKLRCVLDDHTSIECWNVDMEDEDCVLRIVSGTLNCKQVIDLINQCGHECAELT